MAAGKASTCFHAEGVECSLCELKHPCAKTCSGYQQGYEAGAAAMRERAAVKAQDFCDHAYHGVHCEHDCAADRVRALPLTGEK